LSPQERQWIVEAVADVAARTPELSAIDREAEAEACALGDPGYVQAGPAAIAAFESALAPVEAVLAEQPAQAATLEALHELVADIPAEPAATCVHDTELPNTSAVTLRTLIDAPAETTALVPADGEANAAPGGTVPVTYVSDGLTISGRLTVPAGSGPFPAIVIVQPFGGLERAPGRLIDAGYAVLETDLRGRGTSDADPAAGGDLEMGATLDVVNAARALGSDPRIDSTKVALLGSGLGGLLAINAQVVAPDATAAVVAINPSSLDLWENIEFFLAPDDEFRAQIVETRGTPHDNPDLWADLSPVTFVDRVESPLLIVQGTGDTGNDPAWAHDAVEQYDAAGKDGRLTTLKGADFVLDPVWEQAIAEIETFLADSL
jgi:dienelactone hydrolase